MALLWRWPRRAGWCMPGARISHACAQSVTLQMVPWRWYKALEQDPGSNSRKTRWLSWRGPTNCPKNARQWGRSSSSSSSNDDSKKKYELPLDPTQVPADESSFRKISVSCRIIFYSYSYKTYKWVREAGVAIQLYCHWSLAGIARARPRGRGFKYSRPGCGHLLTAGARNETSSFFLEP